MNETDERVDSVSQLNQRIKLLLEGEFRGVWVRGEISNLRRQSSGHCYFSLKDADSQISAVLFRGNAARQSIDLRDGMQVLAYGEVSVYEPRGTYQLIVRVVTDDGAGRLQQEFERLKRKLSDEGLFDPERKRALPPLPVTVGFITSPTGAAIQDFLRILTRRRWAGRVVVLPVKVQGAGAAAEMIEMIRVAQRMDLFDLLVIGRGGGSIEDLWAFNEEPLVRAVAACAVPVVSAVGHEIDFTLTDFAADVRAETPSAAAELISSAFVRCDERFRFAHQSLDALAARLLTEMKRQVEACGNHLRLLSPRQRIEQNHLRLDEMANRLDRAAQDGIGARERALGRLRERLQEHSPISRMKVARQGLKATADRFQRAGKVLLEVRGERLQQVEKRLQSASPQSVLHRGFVLMRDARGQPVPRRETVRTSDRLTATFADGDLPLRVEENA